MCIPQGVAQSKDNGYIQTKPKKHVERVSVVQFEKGDPAFIDERTKPYVPKKKELMKEKA